MLKKLQVLDSYGWWGRAVTQLSDQCENMIVKKKTKKSFKKLLETKIFLACFTLNNSRIHVLKIGRYVP